MNIYTKIFALCFISLSFFSCNWHGNEEGKTVFRYNESAGITSLDPAFAKDQAMIWVNSQLFNGLIQLDNYLQVRPAIAKEWTISPDGKTYTFLLRDDVCFHEHPLFEGERRKVTAQDFVYSFARIIDESVASPGAWIFGNIDSVDNKPAFIAENDSVFSIRVKNIFPPFLSLLGMPYCSVIPHEIAEHYGKDFRRNPVGTGPFKFKFWKEGVKLVLLKNDDYFEKDAEGNSLPYLDAVSVTFIVDKQTAFLEFIKGNLDFMNSIDPAFKDELLTPNGELREKYQEEIVMSSEPYLNTEYLGFLMDPKENNPLLDKKVRQAINYGFDRKKMIKYLRNNIGTPGEYGIIPPGMPGFDAEKMQGYTYNPEKAKRLLAEAGFPNGEGLPELVLSTTQTYLDLCKYIQQQLGLIGLKVKVDVNPPGALREQIAQSKINWFRGSWIADYPDAENYLSLFYSANFSPMGPNYTHYRNENFDKLYTQARALTNDSLRFIKYQEMDRLLIEEAPFVVLYYDQVVHFTHKNIHNTSTNPMNMLNLKYVKKGE
ncbi:ABC transporter substrate-binding protein [Bacteroidales bacterium OttesenSCG-928-C19]|nr:ABC transporter substrate-binding protein [Bacteroidales bacterium OttesenSCG-928-C19]